MKRIIPIAALIIVAACCCAALAAVHARAVDARTKQSKETWLRPSEESVQIAEKARNMVSLTSIGPVEIQAAVRTLLPNGKTKTGTYMLDWAAPDRFCERIHFDGSDAVTVASSGTLYRMRDPKSAPLITLRIEEMMNPGELVALFVRDEAQEASALSSSKNSSGSNPSDESSPTNDKNTLVLTGSGEGTLWIDRRQGWPSEMFLHRTANGEAIKFDRYKELGSGFIAFQRRYLVSDRPVMEADVVDASPISSFPAGTFDPPPNAEKLDWCSDEIPAELQPLKAPLPVTVQDFESPEILDAFVNADGTLSRMLIVGTGGQEADTAIQKLATLIRFTPATCGGKPVASETPFVVSAADIAIAGLGSGKDIPIAGKNGYGLPQCEHCPDPEYSDEAFQAKIQGTVVLQIVIGVDGRAHEIALVKGLEHDLDQQAIKAALLWRFKPATGPDGKPAAVQMPVQITFHLY